MRETTSTSRRTAERAATTWNQPEPNTRHCFLSLHVIAIKVKTCQPRHLGTVVLSTTLWLSARPYVKVNSCVGRRASKVSSDMIRNYQGQALCHDSGMAFLNRKRGEKERESRGVRNTRCLMTGVGRYQISSKAISVVLMHSLSLKTDQFHIAEWPREAFLRLCHA